MQYQHFPDNATEWVTSFTFNHTLSFSFYNDMESAQLFFPSLHLGSTISSILLLIYVEVVSSLIP